MVRAILRAHFTRAVIAGPQSRAVACPVHAQTVPTAHIGAALGAASLIRVSASTLTLAVGARTVARAHSCVDGRAFHHRAITRTPSLVTRADALETLAVIGAVVGAAQLGAVVACVARVTDTLAVNTLALLTALVLADLGAAVVVSPALVATALVIGASAVPVAIIRAALQLARRSGQAH